MSEFDPFEEAEHNLNTINEILFGGAAPDDLGERVSFLSGSGFCMVVRVEVAPGQFRVVKYGGEPQADMLNREFQSLSILANTETVRVPQDLAMGETESGQTFLVMEFLPGATPEPEYWPNLARDLATLHALTDADGFGFEYNNYLGSLPQLNARYKTPAQFICENRLLPLAGQALYQDLITKHQYEGLLGICQRMPDLLPNERPALVHGDFWSGNIVADNKGRATLIDPAIHMGIREADIAMSLLFGGLDDSFYEAYHEVFPMEPGWKGRMPLYQLYPILAHILLFGESYVSLLDKAVAKFK